MNNLRIFLSAIFLLSFNVRAQEGASSYFEKGTQEFGLSNLGIGYSSAGGFLVEANTRYQYYVLNRFAVGGTAFYNNFNSREWMGLGPVASYVVPIYQNWFSRLDQQIVAAKFNGFYAKHATLSGTSALSVNYIPEMTNFFIGAGYAHTYALSEGRVIRPNTLQLFAGWLWR